MTGSEAAELPHCFVFSPPDEAPDSWGLTTPEDFIRRLSEAFPDAGTLPVRSWDAREGRWTLSVEVLVGEVWLEGMVTTPWPGAGHHVDQDTRHTLASIAVTMANAGRQARLREPAAHFTAARPGRPW